MDFDGIFIAVAIISVLTTLTATIKARAVGWLVPFWFLLGWLSGELAVWLLGLQMLFVLTALVLADLDSGTLAWGVALFLASWLGLLSVLRHAFDAGRAFERALRVGLGDDYLEVIPALRRFRLRHTIHSDEWLWPFRFRRPAVRVERNLAYGDAGKRNLLDIYRPVAEGDHRPVLLQIHGGAWLVGHKAEQGQPLLHRMAELGWVGVSINYRLSPAATFPDHIVDVKKAIAWIREHVADFGGNPDFIAVTGGSAGGHLAALAALTPNHPDWQPGFESADTRVQAALPLYACFDFCNRYDIRHRNTIDGAISRAVLKVPREDNPDLWDSGSPVCWVNAEAPPFFVVQGTHDSLIWVEEARRFVAELSAASTAPVVYAELPGTQHAFDFFHSPRTSHFLNAASQYLEWAWADWRGRQVLSAVEQITPAGAED